MEVKKKVSVQLYGDIEETKRNILTADFKAGQYTYLILTMLFMLTISKRISKCVQEVVCIDLIVLSRMHRSHELRLGAFLK